MEKKFAPKPCFWTFSTDSTFGLTGWHLNVLSQKPPETPNHIETDMPVEVTIHVEPFVM